MYPQSFTSVAKADFLSSFTAGLKGLLHPRMDTATLEAL